MSEIPGGAELIARLATRSREVAEYFATLSPAEFFSGDAAKWGPAHHLGHLTAAHLTCALAFCARLRLPSHSSGRSRSIEDLRAAYSAALALAPARFPAGNPFSVTFAPGVTPPDVVENYVDAAARVREEAGTWSEDELDTRAMAHPLMGELTGREMLQFMLDHDAHHLRGVRSRRGGTPA